MTFNLKHLFLPSKRFGLLPHLFITASLICSYCHLKKNWTSICPECGQRQGRLRDKWNN